MLSNAAFGLQLPLRVQTYLHAVVQTCAQIGYSLVSVVLFGSVTKGGFSSVSDVDLIIVLADDTTQDDKRRLREEIARLETIHGFRPPAAHSSGAPKARI